MDAITTLKRECPGFSQEAIQRLSDNGLRNRADVDDVIRVPKGRDMVAEVAGISIDNVKKGMGYSDWPEDSGVRVSAMQAMGALPPEMAGEATAETAVVEVMADIALPNHYSLHKCFGPPRDQGPVGACTSFGANTVLESLQNQPDKDWSEAFTYHLTKASDGHPDTDGSALRFAMPVLVKYGCCLEPTWPYRPDRQYLRRRPPSRAFAEARRFRLDKVISLNTRKCRQLREQLAQGRAVAISSAIYGSSMHSLRFHNQGRFIMPMGRKDKITGYHAMGAIGYYDDDALVKLGLSKEPGGGALLVRNSWGQWAKDNPLAAAVGAGCGYAIMPYAYVEQCCFEAFTATVKTARNATSYTAIPSSVCQSWWQRSRDGVVTAAQQRLAESLPE